MPEKATIVDRPSRAAVFARKAFDRIRYPLRRTQSEVTGTTATPELKRAEVKVISVEGAILDRAVKEVARDRTLERFYKENKPAVIEAFRNRPRGMDAQAFTSSVYRGLSFLNSHNAGITYLTGDIRRLIELRPLDTQSNLVLTQRQIALIAKLGDLSIREETRPSAFILSAFSLLLVNRSQEAVIPRETQAAASETTSGETFRLELQNILISYQRQIERIINAAAEKKEDEAAAEKKRAERKEEKKAWLKKIARRLVEAKELKRRIESKLAAIPEDERLRLLSVLLQIEGTIVSLQRRAALQLTA